ncbi:hypothetical protein HK099_003753 [Clydaea vesicula]|uniref:Partial AB-hydrolase lipase domain-containing protein n=1 Tax=Clydaea vesicula TaxID=447962 RepID=A0AAD5UA75_9FUNG|nr:hypothetical protein HK099_003753 [Clydaea vesicula]
MFSNLSNALFGRPITYVNMFEECFKRLFFRYIQSTELTEEELEFFILEDLEKFDSFYQFCEYWNYKFEEHEVETDDGYLLGLHRIPNKRFDQFEYSHKPAVLIWHGFGISSESFVCNVKPHLNLAFVLADEGFDVWLGNCRGNKYSLKHKSFDINDKNSDFWDFGIDEIINYDIPSTVEYILTKTKLKKLCYCGYSQGAMSMISALSLSEELNEKVNCFVGIGPAPKPVPNKIVKAIHDSGADKVLPLIIGRKHEFPHPFIARLGNSIPMFLKTPFVDLFLHTFPGWNMGKIGSSHRKNVLYKQLLTSLTSSKLVLHWTQIMHSDLEHQHIAYAKHNPFFSNFFINRYCYLKPSTPCLRYPTMQIKTHMHLFWSESDHVSDPDHFKEILPKEKFKLYEVKGYSHMVCDEPASVEDSIEEDANLNVKKTQLCKNISVGSSISYQNAHDIIVKQNFNTCNACNAESMDEKSKELVVIKIKKETISGGPVDTPKKDIFYSMQRDNCLTYNKMNYLINLSQKIRPMGIDETRTIAFGKTYPRENINHALSVSMPTWHETELHLQGKNPIVGNSGYHRCTIHPACLELFEKCRIKYSNFEQEDCFIFPSKEAAKEAFSYVVKNVTEKEIGSIRILLMDELDVIHRDLNLHLLIFPIDLKDLVKGFWVHSGELISSRFAQYCLNLLNYLEKKKQNCNLNLELEEQLLRVTHFEISESGLNAKRLVKERIAELFTDSNYSARDVFLFPTGMSAIYNAHKLVCDLFPNKKTVQFGFSYIDTLKVQEKFGNGCHFLANQNSEDNFQNLEKLLKDQAISAVFTEFPSNPLLMSVDIQRLKYLLDKFNVLLVVDNSLIINPNLKNYWSLYNKFKSIFIDHLWLEDSIVLELNSRSFKKRMRKVNFTCNNLVTYLNSHPKVGRIYFPKFLNKAEFGQLKKIDKNIIDEKFESEDEYQTDLSLKDDSNGGLFSFLLKNEEDAKKFYDNIQLCKGPSFGTSFTLICAYTLLAHYEDLEWAETYGVKRWLIRCSVGLEDEKFLISSFQKAFDSLDPF